MKGKLVWRMVFYIFAISGLIEDSWIFICFWIQSMIQTYLVLLHVPLLHLTGVACFLKPIKGKTFHQQRDYGLLYCGDLDGAKPAVSPRYVCILFWLKYQRNSSLTQISSWKGKGAARSLGLTFENCWARWFYLKTNVMIFSV